MIISVDIEQSNGHKHSSHGKLLQLLWKTNLLHTKGPNDFSRAVYVKQEQYILQNLKIFVFL